MNFALNVTQLVFCNLSPFCDISTIQLVFLNGLGSNNHSGVEV